MKKIIFSIILMVLLVGCSAPQEVVPAEKTVKETSFNNETNKTTSTVKKVVDDLKCDYVGSWTQTSCSDPSGKEVPCLHEQMGQADFDCWRKLVFPSKDRVNMGFTGSSCDNEMSEKSVKDSKICIGISGDENEDACFPIKMIGCDTLLYCLTVDPRIPEEAQLCEKLVRT